MKIKLSKSQWEEIGNRTGWIKEAGWADGYYTGPLKDGYPPSYFDESGNLKYPWQDNPILKRDEIIPRSLTHKEIAKSQNLARPCDPHDLITVAEGLQCGNCLALTRDHGKTWESANKTNKEIKSSDLYKQFIQEGKNPQQAAVELLDILTTGAFVSVEEPKRTEMINKIIEKFSK